MMKFRVLCVILLILVGCQGSSKLLPLRVGGKLLKVELAGTAQARRIGLQGRSTLPENRGMLFVFPIAEPLSFWSKNTQIPLSIAFLDDQGKIVEIFDLPPETITPVVSQLPLRYALEVNAGWFDKHEIGVGDVVRMER